jgi:hypothetical protein
VSHESADVPANLGAAQVELGHSKSNTAEIYAEKDRAWAEEVAKGLSRGACLFGYSFLT